MAYVPLSRFLLRAPLLPQSALAKADQALLAHPLGRDALALASASLMAAGAGEKRRRAINRYGRRAAFRPTPHGLLAGVTVGTLGATTRIATGVPRAALGLPWGRAAALGRALLDDPAVRGGVRLRVTPSLLRSPGAICWIAPGVGYPAAVQQEAELEERLVRILDAAAGWAPWATVRRAAANPDDGAHDHEGSDEGSDDPLDELLLTLIDERLLLHDLEPPLLGRPPLPWLVARLQALPAAGDTLVSLLAVADRLEARTLTGAADALAALPGARAGEALAHGVLLFEPKQTPTLARAGVLRAVKLVPLMFRLQEALAPPASERLLNPAAGEALTTITELFGAGALEPAGLALGDYGVPLHEAETDHETSPPPGALLTLLFDRIAAAARAGDDEVAFTAAELEAALPDVFPPPPPTAELFLTVARSPGGTRPGTGWLLGLHAPAGATWGRFAAALGAPMQAALAALAQAERTARPEVETLDVCFAPSTELADLCTAPPVRARALALTSWPEGTAAVAAGELELGADASAVAPLALRLRDDAAPVSPSPLSRVRSTTAPGLYQLLTGWSLVRQHAPWALALGPLANLQRLPRISIDGFVVAPASWRLPPADGKPGDGPGRLAPRTLGRWRREMNLPRWVQVGHEDRLLPVDLNAGDAAADLAGADRVWELWPPPARGLDRDGRRIEVVIALVDEPEPDDRAQLRAIAETTRQMERVPPPHASPPAAGWTTFKLFGADAHQEPVLVDIVAAVTADALAAGEIDGWFFIRYVEGPGQRAHLRVRAHVGPHGPQDAFARRLHDALAPARDDGRIVAVETTAYFPEHARFGGAPHFAAVQRIFQSDSQLACALLAIDDDAAPDLSALLVLSLDALAAGFGLSPTQRHLLARGRRRATAGDLDDEQRRRDDRDYRARARLLRGQLGGARAGASAAIFAAHRQRIAEASALLPAPVRDRILPALLHLAAVRLGGIDPDGERIAYVLWERTLEGLLRSGAEIS